MSEKIVLIDGHSILNRAFYGIPDLSNSEGLHTNAVYGFLNILFKILDEEQPDYLVVAFDVNAPTFRHKMYKEYKGTRKPMPEELREQVPLMQEVLKAMGIKIVKKEGLEADDILGTIAKQSEKAGIEVSVVSGDRDLLQLATEHIKIRIPKTKRTGTEIEDYYARDVKERYQVTPLEFIDLKALMGDASDNIPGVPGIGEKTATAIISQYGCIENAYENVEQIKPNRAKENLKQFYGQAQMSKELAAIAVESDIDYRLQDAKIGNLFTEAAYELFRRLEFKNLISRFHRTAEEKELKENFNKITMLEQTEEVFDSLKTARYAAFHFVGAEEPIGLSLTFETGVSYLIYFEGFLTREYVAGKLLDVFQYVDMWISPDLKSDLKWLPYHTEPIEAFQKKFFDTGIAAYLLNPLKNDYTYDDLAKEYADCIVPAAEDLFGKVKLVKAAEEKPEEFFRYACYQSDTAFSVYEPLRQKLIETEMLELFEEIEMPLIFTLFDMESAGIKTEGEALKIYGEQLMIRINELEEEIYRLAGEEFNINSPKQLGEILFEHLKLPNGKKTKTGYSTAAEVLDKLAPDHPIVKFVLEYRQLTKLKSTYADGLANYISEDGRIHSSFNQTITATGRISSTEPNLQNIPIRMELGRLIRKVFVTEEGYVFLDADYSQIELRVLAHMSDDERLIQAYREAQDIHRITASQVFHTPFDEVTSLQRRNAKAVNFGIVYGISSFGLSQDLSITKKEAGEYIEKYFETYPGVKKFLEEIVETAKEKGYVASMFGRRRPIPELKSSNFMQRSFGERVAMNSPIQGTAADIIKIAMIRVNEELKKRNLKTKLVLQVHDELLLEVYKPELEMVKEILEAEMRSAANLKVALEVDMNVGKNWYEAH